MAGATALPLLELPAELLSVILSPLDTRDLARLAATCHSLCRDAPTPQLPLRQIGPVEMELRRRAKARGLDVGSSLPDGATSWVACLLKRDRRDAQMRQAPLAVGSTHSIVVHKGGRLLTWGGVSPGPTPVLSTQDKRFVSVATSGGHCLALSADGEVYSWGGGDYGLLGHGDLDERAEPCRIESLSRIERIAAGKTTSAAVDENGRLYTWGQASRAYNEYVDEDEDEVNPGGLGYELDAETEYQTTPKRVDALSQHRVVGVALGVFFTLAVTDAGAIFSFGQSDHGELGHGSWDSQVLPRRIKGTRRRFVAVAASSEHALALTEEGELYGWGHEYNGHRREMYTPKPVAALIGQRVKLITAHDYNSCVVTEKGELFTWNDDNFWDNLGHEGNKNMPTRVDALNGVKVVAVAIYDCRTLATDADGVVWIFGLRLGRGLDVRFDASGHLARMTPTPFRTLRVRVLNSP